MRTMHVVSVAALGALVACTQGVGGGETTSRTSSALDALGTKDPDKDFNNPAGKHQTISLSGTIDGTNAFFQSLGTNGRSCGSCHAPNDALGLSAATARKRFFATCHDSRLKGDEQPGNGGSAPVVVASDADNGIDDGTDNDNHEREGEGDPVDQPDNGKRYGGDLHVDNGNHNGANKGATCGDDPLFRLHDGANSPNADVSTDEARLQAYSLLLTKGLVRIQMAIAPTAEFEVIGVVDPYNYATTSRLSFYRRPLPATNLRFSGAFEPARRNAMPIMWDGRETETGCVAGPAPAGAKCGTGLPACRSGQTCSTGFCRILPQCSNPPISRVVFDVLKSQANHAHLGHAQAASPLTDEQQISIVNFERDLITAQSKDRVAGRLSIDGANGGPQYLATVPFTTGENRAPPIGPGFGDFSFTIYNGWINAQPTPGEEGDGVEQAARRASIARGQDLFNHRRGINPKLGVKTVNGRDTTCVFCHSAFESGSDSAGTWGNGVSDAIGAFVAGVPSADLPYYTVRHKKTGKIARTSDLGRAAVTGKFNDLNKFKAPVLRSLSGRAPYFHNGSAATLGDVVDAYQGAGFQFNFTASERADLVAFLETL